MPPVRPGESRLPELRFFSASKRTEACCPIIWDMRSTADLRRLPRLGQSDCGSSRGDSELAIGNIALMQSPGREPSMEDILASIKKVIAEEKELRSSPQVVESVEDEPLPEESSPNEEDVLELDQPLAPSIDLGPPLVDEQVAGQSRQRLEALQTVAAAIPPAPTVNPLEEIIREMLRPMLKQWLDEHLPQMVDEHVKREISRITGRQL